MSFSRRLAIVFGAIILCFAALAVRLARVQVLAGGEYRLAGTRQAAARVDLPEPRGEIRDRHASPLAYSEKGFDLWADVMTIARLDRVADEVSRAIGADSLDILGRLARAESRVCLRRGLSIEEAEHVRALGTGGLALEETWRRRYPLGASCVHLLGIVGRDGKGLEGLEFAWDEILSGRAGRRRLREDAHRRMIDLGRGVELPGIPAAHLVLTIDAGLQRIVHEEMARVAARIEPLGGAAVVLEPATGEVRALVSWPAYEPSAIGQGAPPPGSPGAPRPSAGRPQPTAPAVRPGMPRRSPSSQPSPSEMRNRPVQDAHEPGSTFKPFAVAWALERGAIRPGQRIDCENGAWRLSRDRVIHDPHPRGVTSIEEILIYSSNIGVAKIGRKLGADGLYEALRAFGFGRKPGTGLPGEAGGLIRPRTAWSYHTVVSVPFGQELAVTPLQLVTGYAALVNGGLRVRPIVIEKLVDGEGRTLREFPRGARERVLSEATSRWVRATLRAAVEKGTGRRARVARFAIGGKTGTAQKYERDEVTGEMRPSARKTVASFVGFAPAEEPRLVCLVMWDEPRRDRSGGAAAAPVVGRILERAFAETGARQVSR